MFCHVQCVGIKRIERFKLSLVDCVRLLHIIYSHLLKVYFMLFRTNWTATIVLKYRLGETMVYNTPLGKILFMDIIDGATIHLLTERKNKLLVQMFLKS